MAALDLTSPNIEATDQVGEAAPPEVRLVSIDTAAQLLGIGRTTIYDLVNRGLLRSLKIGRRTLLPVEDIDAFVNRKLASTSSRCAGTKR